MKNPQTTIALTFLTQIISDIDGVVGQHPTHGGNFELIGHLTSLVLCLDFNSLLTHLYLNLVGQMELKL